MEWKITYPGGQPQYGQYDRVAKYAFRVSRSGDTVLVSFQNQGEKGLRAGSISIPDDVARRLGHVLALVGSGRAEATFEHD